MSKEKEICKSLSDVQIIEFALKDINYYTCLYERYQTKLLNYIRTISLAGIDESQDILQEAFIKVWINLNSYDKSLKFSSWLYRIVHNETISYCRKKRSFGKNKQVNIDEVNLNQFAYEYDQSIDYEKRYYLTHEVLARLDLKYREVLILKFMEKMDYREISDVLKIPEGTVATRINRAKKTFTKEAEKQRISFKD